MKIFWCIARHELRRLFKSFRLIGAMTAVMLVVPPSLVILAGIQEEEHKDFLEDFVSLEEQVKRAEGLSRLPLRITLKPRPLAFLNRGVLDQINPTIAISRLEPPQLSLRSSAGSWLYYLFPSLDLASILIVLFSLIPFVFGYGFFSTEKEEGTLKLVLVNSVSRAKLILGKVTGMVVASAFPYSLVIVLSLGLIMSSPIIRLSMNPAEWLNFWVFFAFAGIYYLTNLLLALLASVLTHRSANTLLALLFIWLGGLILAPSLGITVAELAVPSQRTSEFLSSRERLNQALIEDYVKLTGDALQASFDLPDRALKSHGIETFFLQAKDQQFRVSRNGELWADRIQQDTESRLLRQIPELVDRQQRTIGDKRRLYSKRVRNMLSQMRLARMVDFLSPSSLFLSASAEAIGTGPRTVANFFFRLTSAADQFFAHLSREEVFRSPLFLSEMGRTISHRSSYRPDVAVLRIEQDPSQLSSQILFYFGYASFLLICLYLVTHIVSIQYDPR